MATVDNLLQVTFENEVETVHSKEQLLEHDANSLLLGQLIIQNDHSKVDVSKYIADETVAKRVAEFIKEFIELIIIMMCQKKKLEKSLKAVNLKVSVIFFNNWSWTVIRLLFLVKPTTREEVVAVVNACKHLKIKVSFCMHH